MSQRVLNTKHKLSAPARIARKAGVQAGDRLSSMGAVNTCVVTAIGLDAVFGYWLQRDGEIVSGPHHEAELQLHRHDWMICTKEAS